MKRLIILVLLVFTQINFASSEHRFFYMANQLYLEKDYSKAAELYQQIITDGNENAFVYYNLGNCYYRMNKYGLAILYYEKAKLIEPDDESIKKNLIIANNKIIDKIQPIQRVFFLKWIDAIIDGFSLNFLTWLSINFFWLVFISLAIQILSRKIIYKKIMFITSIVFFILFLIFSFFSYQSYEKFQNTKNGIVIVNSVYVKSSPDATSTDLFILHEGTKFEIIDKMSDWVKIKLVSGATGWVDKSVYSQI
jgi:tetratricopeptide (TPR) repeat protein